MKRSQNGTGTVYRQEGRGANWLIAYYVRGKRTVATSGTTDKREARRTLNAILAAIDSGGPVPEAGKRKAITFDAAAAAYVADLRRNNRSSADHIERVIQKHLRDAFRGRLDAVTKERIDSYADDRLAAGARPATVNGELGALKRIFRVATTNNRIAAAPTFKLLALDNAREGFFEQETFDAVIAAVPVWLRGPLTFAYLTGWRLAAEVCTLQWRHVDLRAGIVKIDTSKNGEGRTFPINVVPGLRDVLAAADAVRKASAARDQIVPWVFHRDGVPLTLPPKGSKRCGDLRGFVRHAWLDACIDAGTPGSIPHDFRRTAVRNLVRARVPEKIAMTLTGHKTREVFERYNIVDESDLAEAVTRYADWLAAPRTVTLAG